MLPSPAPAPQDKPQPAAHPWGAGCIPQCPQLSCKPMVSQLLLVGTQLQTAPVPAWCHGSVPLCAARGGQPGSVTTAAAMQCFPRTWLVLVGLPSCEPTHGYSEQPGASLPPGDSLGALRCTGEKSFFHLLAANTQHTARFFIVYYALFFLFWMEENIKLKFLYEENNCLWQAVYQSVWQYLLSAILCSWKKASLALCLETAGIYTHLDSKTPPALLLQPS